MPSASSLKCGYAEADQIWATSMSKSPRMLEDAASSAVYGNVHWKPLKSLWITAMTAVALIGGAMTATWEAVLLFVSTTAITICLGHSLGMHRRLIHRAYECPHWLEWILVYLGTLVGMSGPFGMIRQHDIRDWAQRKSHCHPYLAHRTSLLRDAFWQMHCELELKNPPIIEIEPRVAGDRFYRFLECTWMAQQLPWALVFFACGGMPWVVWGIAVRVSASVTGHWLVGHFAHNSGARTWHVTGAGVQGYNIRYCGLITMGEAFHNNHHAFPGSARLGLSKGEIDPGWHVLQVLRWVGLVWDLKTPELLPTRPTLVRLENDNN